MAMRRLQGAALKKFRSDVAKLKKMGLVGKGSKKIDARSQKPTRYMREQIKKYQDVLDGKAKVVSTKKYSEAKKFSKKYRTKFNKVIVAAKKDETLRYAPKQKKIIGTRTVKGKKVKREITSKIVTGRERIPEDKSVLYTIPVGNARMSFDTYEDLKEFMEPYEYSLNPYIGWEKYVEINYY